MNEEAKIRQLLYRFESTGLVEKNLDLFLQCLSDHILGIGMGEQGFVTSIQDVREIYITDLKAEDTAEHTVDYNRVEILRIKEDVAVVCADVQVNSHPLNGSGKVIKSQFQQSLTVIREDGEWKVCGLHASTPIVTEETLEAFPLKLAEKTLRSLREKIGEEVYLAEEQYRRAVLADAVAFYIVNFSADCVEKCQLQNDLCVYVEPYTPYGQFIENNAPLYIFPGDVNMFLSYLSAGNIEKAFHDGTNEVFCEYRMKTPHGNFIWVKTIVRLIKDVVTGDKKGIMYVKNIDEEKRAARSIKEQAECDSMTKVLNKGTMMQRVNALMQQEHIPSGGVLLMIDVDDFKTVNDAFGHPVGDQVLVETAKRMQEIFAPPALIGRLGGDEFGIFICGRQLDEDIRHSATLLLQSVRSLELSDAPGMQVSISIGAAYLDTGNFQALYQAADSALYQAKRSGKNSVVYLREPIGT